jgi:glycosyltransferase involved in cell wall biosynthesis
MVGIMTTEMGKVSMVVPCYNKEPYIGAMLASVCNQVWDRIELILVNDGSTDGTREVIREWQPRLEARGYEVIVLDRENGGCCAALHSGLQRMTGDYFCLVDCDDELYPEYVSRMAGWLDTHEDYAWAAVSSRAFTDVAGARGGGAAGARGGGAAGARGGFAIYPYPQDTEQLLARYIFRSVITTVWIYLARVSYVKSCGLIANFCTERRATYEPLIAVPLMTGGGKLKFFEEPLYKYNTYANGLFSFDSFTKALSYYEDYLYLYDWAIARTTLSPESKREYLALTRLAYMRELFLSVDRSPDGASHLGQVARATTALLDEYLTPAPYFQPELLVRLGYIKFFTVLEEALLAAAPWRSVSRVQRVIGYGALGKMGSGVLPQLLGTPAEPEVLWDYAAEFGTQVYGIPVVQPDFSAVTASDVILVFPKAPEIARQVRTRSGDALVISHAELEEWLPRLVFRALAGCKLRAWELTEVPDFCRQQGALRC